jgi:hypothetical protein
VDSGAIPDGGTALDGGADFDGGLAADAGLPPDGDASVPPPDGGGGSGDGGNSSGNDSGSPTFDAGDAGMSGADAGPGAIDSGTSDSGTALSDSGAAPAESGNGATDSGGDPTADAGASDGGSLGGGPCGTVAYYQDDFEDNQIQQKWFYTVANSGDLTSENGTLNMTLSTGALLNDQVALSGRTEVSIVDSSLSVRMDETAAPGSEIRTTLRFFHDDENYFEISVIGATMRMRMRVDGSGVPLFTSYSSVNDAYWRIVESGGTVDFQTSPDAVNWETHRSDATPAWAAYGRVLLGIQNESDPLMTGGQVTFDDLAILPPGSGTQKTNLCALDSFSWDFTAADPALPFYEDFTNGCSSNYSNNELAITVTTDDNCRVVSRHAFDVTDSQVVVRFKPSGAFATGVLFGVALHPPWGASEEIRYLINGGQIWAGVASDYALLVASATRNYLRIRNDAGTIRFEYSADGNAWTEDHSIPLPANFDQGHIVLMGGHVIAGGSVNVTNGFDRVNP